jgi:hypothetical protein
MMNACLKAVEGNVITLEVKIALSGSMLSSEESILSSLNEAGSIATGEALKRFDTDGTPLMIGGEKWFSKGELPKSYQTPYGVVEVRRHVYQRSRGGQTFCPLEREARMILTSTPRFAKVATHKMANGPSTIVQSDLEENHGRKVARSYLQNLSAAVGSIVEAKEEVWEYATPKIDRPIKTVAISMDGTCVLCEGSYREAMTGTISLYDKAGERQHTIYLGATPEYGKATFQERMTREITHIKKLYPRATYIGIADGARANWDFLESHVSIQVLDFYHATQYLSDVAMVAAPDSEADRIEWLDERCHRLKHEEGAAARILKEMESLRKKKRTAAMQTQLDSAITYFRNHKHQMNYAQYQDQSLPIGSGVTEAACKTLIKQRLCCSGMKWVEQGARIILSLRALVLTPKRWEQFWNKISQYGIPITS